MNREFKVGDVVKHFKRETNDAYTRDKTYLYQIISFAKHTETGEKMVVYKSLYENIDMNISIDEVFVRPYDMFVSEVDRDKYPNIRQKYRFEHYAVKSNKELSETTNSDLKDEFLRTINYLVQSENKMEMICNRFADSTNELSKCFHYMVKNALTEQRQCSLSIDTCTKLHAKKLKDIGFDVTPVYDSKTGVIISYKIFW